MGVLFGVFGVRNTNHAHITNRHVFEIILGKDAIFVQVLVETLTDAAVGTVSSNENFALMRSAVSAVNEDLAVLFFSADNLFVQTDLVGRNLLEDQLVEARSCEQEVSVTGANRIKDPSSAFFRCQ